MLYKICYLFLLFLIYAIIGWLIEVLNFLTKEHQFVNRGFLIGPYCPIYGIGVLLIIFLLKDYLNKPLALFILSMFLCMTLEYFTSYLMEKSFHARWWDYSKRKYNINGRICLETTIPFGIFSMIIMYLINPFINNILNIFSHKLIIIISLILMMLFLIDIIVSLIVIIKFRNKTISYKDETDLFNKKVKDYLINHSLFMKRLLNSFPGMKFKLKKHK